MACKDAKLEQEVQSLREQNELLLGEGSSQDSLLAEYMETFNEISTNLSAIREKEASIELESETPSKGAKEKITEDIQIINTLMEQNKQKIDDLDKKLRNAYYSNNKLKKAMDEMKEGYLAQIQEKDEAITTIKGELEKMQISVEELNGKVSNLTVANQKMEATLQEKEDVISQQVTEKNTAFYAVGTSKKLTEENILTKEGGFIGLGKSSKFSGNASNEAFTKIDITEIRNIPVQGKKASLVTNHPDGSYEFSAEGEDQNLVILDPDKFWQTSKYLVVMVN